MRSSAAPDPHATPDALHADVVRRTALRFAAATEQRSTYYYVVSKLRSDPFTRAVTDLGPLGDVLDIGCGRGQVALFLLEGGLARRVRAVDWDDAKIALARRAANGLDASFESIDLRETRLEPVDTVLLVDVLHYLDARSQDELVSRAADVLRPGGRLIVRDATTGRGWRSLVTIFVERISRLIRFNLGERIAVRDISREIVPVLESKGMTCTVTPCWRGTPFSNVLLVATRRREA